MPHADRVKGCADSVIFTKVLRIDKPACVPHADRVDFGNFLKNVTLNLKRDKTLLFLHNLSNQAAPPYTFYLISSFNLIKLTVKQIWLLRSHIRFKPVHRSVVRQVMARPKVIYFIHEVSFPHWQDA